MYNVLKIRFEAKKKSGSALLLGLMIMSVILSSTLYINVLSIRSTSQSQNIDNSIVAFYAAETGNEQAIYYIRKTEDLDVTTLEIPNGEISGPDSLVLRDVADSVPNVLIALKEDETYQLDVFDQDDLSSASLISYIRLSWNDDCESESKIELTTNEWEAGENVEWGSIQNINKCLLDTSPVKIDGSEEICSDVVLDEANSYQFRFKALNCDISNLSIRAFDSSDESISFQNIYEIESVGEYPVDSIQSNRQALRVNLRKFSPLSGLFDYVLFSEKPLVKDVGAYNEGWFSDDLLITTDSLPDARFEEEYSYTMRAVNGNPSSYSWSLDSTTLPELNIDENTGVVSGTIAHSSATYLLSITVGDGSEYDSKILFLKVNE